MNNRKYTPPKYEPDGTCFLGMEKVDLTDFSEMYEFSEECPRCKGHGGWVLTIDAYGLGQHFKASCGACWGYGHIKAGQCLHEWEKTKAVAMCMSEWTCKKCGQDRLVDSSG